MIYPSIETIKRAIFRALETGTITGLIGITVVPFNISEWADLKPYGLAVLFAFVVGFISGILKLIKGYKKYDL